MQGIQKFVSVLINKTRKHHRLVSLLVILLFSAILMSTGIYLKGNQPYDRFRNGFELEYDGILFSGELFFKFRQVDSDVSLEIIPSVISSSPSWIGRFIDVTITSEVLNLNFTELETATSITISDWNLQEKPVKFSISSSFVIMGEGKERRLTEAFEFHFLAGKSVTYLPALLGSTGFLITIISTAGLVTWLYLIKPRSEITREKEPGIEQQGVTCENCGLSTPEGMLYCVQCGSQLLQQCTAPNCGNKFPVRARFCPFCGMPAAPGLLFPVDMEKRGLGSRIVSGFIVTSFCGFLGIMIVNTLLLVPAYTLIFSQFNLIKRFPFTIFLPFPLTIIEFSGLLLLLYVLIIFIVVFYLLSRTIYSDFKQLLSHSMLENRDGFRKIGEKFHTLNDNGFVLLFKLYTMSFALQVTITILYTISGIEITSPVTVPEGDNGGDLEASISELLPSWNSYPSLFISLIFGLVNAAIYEEIILRILFIGLPIFLLEFLRNVKQNQRKADFKQIIGSNIASERSVNRIEWLLIALSSVIFGAAHLISWDLWKFFPATVVGVFLGYIFVKKGLAYAVFLHAAYDYMVFSLLLRFIDVNALFGTSDPISGLLSISMPFVLIGLIVSFIVSGYFFIVKWLKELNSPGDSHREEIYVE